MNYKEQEEFLKIMAESHYRAFDKYIEPKFEEICERMDRVEGKLKDLESEVKKLQGQMSSQV